MVDKDFEEWRAKSNYCKYEDLSTEKQKEWVEYFKTLKFFSEEEIKIMEEERKENEL